ncbi:receptor-type adenylate cyclase a-like protein [Leptomonas pyrrhocoris]|uniref:adenylate cyclase n=1 Tax=Leptomonas pyrrhocoris TaxID=157538 RepID=A0A0M9G3B2_LEPPY|nr:receptor-type adenylate cyclase a-like protein [Leptomonas pyrrhocoris]KPA81299.1 receptor-type adenylate cyclase a-like protein [Leptomonas pyrrhocoris]|eukprot:XP_015659738.1 receptor-type adenylate cyclase a-like protein [Leptomonas pyrrhocoris]
MKRALRTMCPGHGARLPRIYFLTVLLCVAVIVPRCAEGAAETQCYVAENGTRFLYDSIRVGAASLGVTCAPTDITSSDPSNYLTSNRYPVALVATGSDAQLSTYVTAVTSKNNSFTVMIPFTDGTTMFASNTTSTYFTSSEPATEMLALLTYALRTLNPLKIGFVFSSLVNNAVSTAVYNEFVLRMNGLSRSSDVVAYNLVTDKLDNEAFPAFVEVLKSSARSCVFLFTPYGGGTAAVFEALITDSNVNATIMMPSWLMEMGIRIYTELSSRNTPHLKSPSFIVMSSSNPHPQDSRWAAMSTFAHDVGASALVSYGAYTATGVQAVAGWIAGKLAAMSLLPSSLLSPYVYQTTYQTSLFTLRRYTVGGDLLLGPFTNTCNVGGRMVLVHSLAAKVDKATNKVYYGLDTITDADMLLKPTECRAADVKLDASRLVQVGLLDFATSVSGTGNYLSRQAVKGGQANTPVSFYWRSLPMSADDDAAVAAAVAADPVAALTGPIPMPLKNTSASSLLLIEPVFTSTALWQRDSNVVYLTPTNEQQWGAIAAMLADLPSLRPLHFLTRTTRSASGSSVNAVAKTVLDYAGLANVTIFETTEGQFRFPINGVMVLSGLTASDMPSLAAHMQSSKKLYAVILFDEFTALYSDFQTHFPATKLSSTSRLLFVTNLSHWRGGGSSRSATVPALTESFVAAVPDSAQQTPAALRAYLASRVLQQLSSSVSVPSSSALRNVLYQKQILNVDGLQLGPFQLTNCDYSTTLDSFTCHEFLNAGAAALYVWSYERVRDPSTPVMGGPYLPLSFRKLPNEAASPGEANSATDNANSAALSSSTSPSASSSSPSSPTSTSSSSSSSSSEDSTNTTTTSVAPHDHGGSNSSRNTTIIVVVVCAYVLVLVVVAVLLWLCCRGDSRDNGNAPKDASQPVTLMFTDIESSTALWAMAPQAMAAAMVMHHSMMRELIVRYKCYEVKTIGDSFMIACADPFAAVQLARDVQLNFLNADWGSTTIDDTYAALGKAGACGGGGAAPRAWNGLRVRIGVHRGMAEVRLDEVTKGYDYYGETANTAARTESAGRGGQVLCTSSVVEALTAEQRGIVDLIACGSYRLRGVPELVEMYELRVVEGRVFSSSAAYTNPLVALGDAGGVAGADNPMVNSDDDDDDDAASHAPSNLGQVEEVLNVYFSAHSDRQKIKLLQRNCKYFSLPKLLRKSFASDDAYLNALIQLVSARTSAVIDFKHRLQESDAIGPLLDVVGTNAEEACASGATTPAGWEWNADRRWMMGNSCAHSTNDTVGFLLDSSVLRMQDGGWDTCETDGPVKAAQKDPVGSPCDAADVAEPQYLNGKPAVNGNRISTCFEEVNGMLFRVMDTTAGRWAFYNDTKDFVMHVHFSLDVSSVVQWGPRVVDAVRYVPATNCYEGELLVAPLATEILLTGKVNGYSTRYSATLAEDDD